MPGQQFVDQAECQLRIQKVEVEIENLKERVDAISKVVDEVHKLSLSVERLAVSIEHTISKQDVHEKRLNAIEKHDGDMWKSVVKYTITAVVGILVGFLFKQIGIF
jgi:transcription elongation factor Elf1